MLRKRKRSNGQKDQTLLLTCLEQYLELLKSAEELNAKGGIDAFGINYGVMHISADLDRKLIKHDVVMAVFDDCDKLKPLLYGDDKIIIPMSSEAYTLSIVMPLKNYRYVISKS